MIPRRTDTPGACSCSSFRVVRWRGGLPAGLICNFDNGLAPYIAYATSYNPVIGLNASNQLLLPETGKQAEVGLKFQPNGFNAQHLVRWDRCHEQQLPEWRSPRWAPAAAHHTLVR